MAEHQLPKLTVRVRFPSSAPENYPLVRRHFRERSDSTAINGGSVHPADEPIDTFGCSSTELKVSSVGLGGDCAGGDVYGSDGGQAGGSAGGDEGAGW